jgi:hypothetical protein
MIKPPAKSAMFPPDEFIGFGLQLAADLLKGRQRAEKLKEPIWPKLTRYST